MRPRRSLSFRYALLLVPFCSVSLFVTPSQAFAQTCAGTVQSVTLTNPLSGSGSSTYSTAVPQYNSAYTLISAVITAYATTNAAVGLQNNSSSGQDFYPEVDRSDVIKIGATTLSHVNSSFAYDETILAPAGSSGDNLTYAAQNVYTNQLVAYDSITTGNLLLSSNFEGAGNVNFTYLSTTSLNYVPTVVTATSTISDNISFSVTYYFCNPMILAENILTFTATKENDKTIALNWMTTNEQAGRKYFVELSTDGANDFTDIATQASDPVNSDASYSYNYSIGPNDKDKLYFRVKQVDPDGRAAYSEVRIIDLGTVPSGPGFSIYPNPPTSDFINIVFPSTGSNWQVDVLAADGRLVQRNFYSNVSSTQLNFIRKLSAGAYFVRATDQQTASSHVAPFVIR